jgi:cell division septation protein DedD
MGALTVRNLTYLAVGLCVFALIYLIRQSIAKKDRDNAAIASTGLSSTMGDSASAASANQSLGGGSPATDDHLGAGTGTSSSTSSTAAPSGLVKTTPTPASTTTVRTAPSGGGSSASSTVADASAQNHTKLTSKGGTATTKTTSSDKPTYTTAGDKGDFWVIAGSFKDAAGANARVAELKKQGFAYAAAVKDASTGNTRVVAAKFPYNGGAEAEVRNLKKHNVDAFIAKQ